VKPVTVISGKVAALDRANVDTDQIIPKQFLKRVERSGFGEFLFWDWFRQPGFPLNRIEFHGAPILAAGRNFGSGSSREHAPWALQDYGYEAIVAPSFSDIFYSNCTKIGLLPVELPEADVRELIDRAPAEATIDLERRTVVLNLPLDVQAAEIAASPLPPAEPPVPDVPGAGGCAGAGVSGLAARAAF